MTDKMIQINIEDMKKELGAMQGYYGTAKIIERQIVKVADLIDENKPVSAHRKLLDLQDKLNEHYDHIKKLTTMLTDAGCVLD